MRGKPCARSSPGWCETMEIEILSKRENPWLDRLEVRFRVNHPKEPTPERSALRAALTKELQASKGVLILDFARSTFGRHESTGYAKLYSSEERARAVETKPILIRNGLIAKEKKEKPAAERKPPRPKAEAAQPVAPGEEEKPAVKREPKPAKAAEAKPEKPAPEKKAKAAKPTKAAKAAKKEA